MANWNNPTVTSVYTDVPTELKDRDSDTATWFEGSTSTNIPTNTKRYNPSSNTFETWDGASWNQLDLSLASFISGVGNNQVLYTNGSGVVTGSSGLTFDGSNLMVSGNLTVDTNTLFVDAATNRVGIGTLNPGGNLSIAGAGSDVWTSGSSGLTINGDTSGISTITTYLDTSSIRIGAGISLKTGLKIDGHTHSGGSKITFQAGGSERVRIRSNGNVGIGSDGSLGRLDVSTVFGPQLVLGFDSSNYLTCTVNSTGTSKWEAFGSAAEFRFNLNRDDSGGFVFNNANANAKGAAAQYQTEGAARGYIGALKHGTSGDALFTGEAADGFGIRAETVMQFGIGATGVMQMTSAGLYIGGLSNPVGKLTISGGHAVQIGNNYGFLAMGAGNDFSNYEGVLVSHQGGVSSKFISLGEGTGTPRPFYWSTWNGSSSTNLMSLQTDGSLTVGFIGTPSARIHAVSTTEQLRLGYDGSNYASHTVDASGNYTIAPTGGLFTVTLSTRSLILSSPTAGSLLLNSGSASMTGLSNTGIGAGALYSNTTGDENTGIGYQALYSNTTSDENTGIGYQALYSSTGSNNTGIGWNALYSNTTGYANTGIGGSALYNNTTGYANTGIGLNVLYSNTTGDKNTGIGYQALYSSTGSNNTGIGYQALYSSTGSNNTGIGADALYSNTTGIENTGIGANALYNNTVGNANTGIGYRALYNTVGLSNTGIGHGALYSNTSGYYNTGIGTSALFSNTSGHSNTGIGRDALANLQTGANNTGIGYSAMASSTSVSNEITLGDANVTALRCNVTTITSLSDKRDKSEIEEIKNALDLVEDLNPVSFTWSRRDGTMNGVKDSGFIAQELKQFCQANNIDWMPNLVYESNPEKLEASYSKLLPLMVAAIKELKSQVNYLKQGE